MITRVDCEHGVPADAMAEAMALNGAVLLAEACPDLEAFERASTLVTDDFSSYVGAGGGFSVGPMARTTVGDRPTVLTTTGADQSRPIPLHGEMHYHPDPPAHLWFWCEVPPLKGGETTVADGVLAAAALDVSTRSWLEANPVAYHRCLPSRAWQTTFGMDDPERLTSSLAAIGVEASFDAKSSLETRWVASALRICRGEPCLIANILPVIMAEWLWKRGEATAQLDRCPMVVRAADGGEIPAPVIRGIGAACNAVATRVAWKQGDALLLDNLRVMHGRMGSPDPRRRIAVRLGTARQPVES